MKVLTPSETTALETEAFDKEGLSPDILMDRASQSAHSLLNREESLGKCIILCGKGNNGGDGLGLALLLGKDALVCLPLGDPSPDSPGGQRLTRWRARGGAELSPESLFDSPYADLSVVDALFGTGLNREIKGETAGLIARLNREGRFLLSLDIPSGVNGRTGRIEGVAVKSPKTVTFILPKRGHFLSPGRSLCGDLFLADLGIKGPLVESFPAGCALSLPPDLPRRNEDGFKGSWGHLLVVGGSVRYRGAPRFSAEAFLRSGGGFVHLACPSVLTDTLALALPEAVLHPQGKEGSRFLTLREAPELIALARKAAFAVIGPGMGREEETASLTVKLVEELEIPLILDGDALAHVAGRGDLIRRRNVIMTPHPGEMARLLGLSTDRVIADPAAALEAGVDAYGCPLILKGAPTLIGSPGENRGSRPSFLINLSGDSSLATAGSGDVLCGVIASCLGMGLTGRDALAAAVFLHGMAGERAGEKRGRDGVLARDILEALPGAVREYRRHPGKSRDFRLSKKISVP